MQIEEFCFWSVFFSHFCCKEDFLSPYIIYINSSENICDMWKGSPLALYVNETQYNYCESHETFIYAPISVEFYHYLLGSRETPRPYDDSMDVIFSVVCEKLL